MIHQDFDYAQFRGAVLLVGSGMSADKESNLPNGKLVSDGLIQRLVRPPMATAYQSLGLTTGARATIERIALDAPFEVVLQHYPDKLFCQDALRQTYSQGRWNRYHLAVKEAVEAGHFAHIITTNYDTLFEHAGIAATTVIDKLQRDTIDLARERALFKIHGCVSQPSSLVFHLSQEGMLPKWKQEFLMELIRGRDLVVVGYSGRDFDICPILFRSPYTRMVWLFGRADPLQELSYASHNLRYVHQHPQDFPNVFASGGGFDRMFSALLVGKPRFEADWSEPKLVASLFAAEAAKQDAFNLWRAEFLHSIACPVGTAAALAQLTPVASQSLQALDLRASMLERVGSYRKSIDVVRTISARRDRTQNPDDWLRDHFVEAGRHYTSGNIVGLLRVRRWHARAADTLAAHGITFDTHVHDARCAYLDMLVAKALRQLPVIGKIVRRIIGENIDPHRMSVAAKIRYHRGEWQDLHLIRTAADDLKVQLQIGSPTGNAADADRLLPLLDSFSQLNNLVGRAAAYRRVDTKDQQTCQELLEALAAFGHYGEFWKAFRSFGSLLSDRVYWSYRSLCIYSHRGCEYSALLKLRSSVALRAALFRMDRTRRGSVGDRP